MKINEDINILTVSELNKLIKVCLDKNFGYLFIEGEISNLKTPSSGHTYFTLKDEQSQVQCIIFKTERKNIPFELKDGLKIFGGCRINLYIPRGEYRLIFDFIEPKGIGALELAFRQLKEKLEKEGIFDKSKKKPLPILPKKVAIVTSETGAVIKDFINISYRRYPNYHLLICPVKVQGQGAKEEICEALARLNEMEDIDVIVLARGGGSLEDLWAFNEESVARSISASTIPVVSAVGHEVDFTISDFVSDLRAPTPSAAAELILPVKKELELKIAKLSFDLKNLAVKVIDEKSKSLETLKRLIVPPKAKINELRMNLDESILRIESVIKFKLSKFNEKINSFLLKLSKDKLKLKIERLNQSVITLINRHNNALTNCLNLKKQRFSDTLNKLNTLSPISTLARGYSITRKFPKLKVVKSKSDVSVNDKVLITVVDGEIKCIVIEKA